MKGADVAMSTIVQYNDWLEEEVRKKINIYKNQYFIKMQNRKYIRWCWDMLKGQSEAMQ